LITSLFNNRRNKIRKKKSLLLIRSRSDLQLLVSTISWTERETILSRTKKTTKRISSRELSSFFRDSLEEELNRT